METKPDNSQRKKIGESTVAALKHSISSPKPEESSSSHEDHNRVFNFGFHGQHEPSKLSQFSKNFRENSIDVPRPKSSLNLSISKFDPIIDPKNSIDQRRKSSTVVVTSDKSREKESERKEV